VSTLAWSAVVISLLSPAPAPRVRVNIVFDGLAARSPIAVAAVREASAIWTAYGVDVRLADSSEPADDGGVTLRVRLVAQHRGEVPADALGSIRFVEGSPEPVIQMYADAIEALIDGSVLPFSVSPLSPLHDLVVGRAFGRALAHEIGHYLLRWRHHDARGLMRACHSALDLVVPERRSFALAPIDVMRLNAVLAMPEQ